MTGMDKRMMEAFNQEVENYRRALVYFARKCDWAEFKARAGRLFDYLEFVEATVREQKFYRVFFSILAMLVVAGLLITGWNPGENADLQRYKQNFLFVLLAVSSFELFFYINFRRYVEIRESLFSRRRADFIRDLEQDFQQYAEEPMQKAA